MNHAQDARNAARWLMPFLCNEPAYLATAVQQWPWLKNNAADHELDVCKSQSKPQWEPKNWGRVWHRFYDAHVGESLLEVVAGQRCSMHYHEQRANAFVCISAEINVEVYGNAAHQNDVNPYKIPYRDIHASGPCIARLTAGSAVVILPRVWHLFKVKKPGRVVEIYYCSDGTAPRQDDIVRFDVGCNCEV